MPELITLQSTSVDRVHSVPTVAFDFRSKRPKLGESSQRPELGNAENFKLKT